MNIKELINNSSKDAAVKQTNVKFNGGIIKVASVVDFNVATAIVNYVANACIDSTNLSYNPVAKDFATAVAIIKSYTDVDMNDMSEDDVASIYTMMYTTGLMKCITNAINDGQLRDIIAAIDEKIEKIVLDNEREFTAKVQEVYSSVGDIANSINNVFEDVDGETMKNIISLMGTNGISENDLAKAILKSQR